MIGGVEEIWDGTEPDVFDGTDELDVLRSSGGSAEEARHAGDDAFEGLDKVTRQMTGGEHRPEQQEMCRAVAEAVVTRTHMVVQAGTGTGKSWPTWSRSPCPASRQSSPRPPERASERCGCLYPTSGAPT